MDTDIYVVKNRYDILCVSVPVITCVLIPVCEFEGDRNNVVIRLGRKYPDTSVVDRLKAYNFVSNIKETICKE